MLHKEITERVICAFYKVYNTFGHGFLEKVYENALAVELRKYHLKVDQQQAVKVFYEGDVVGDYIADLVVSDSVIVELKAAEAIHPEHYAQLMNCLKATRKEVGMLLNFGLKPEFKRVAMSHSTSREP